MRSFEQSTREECNRTVRRHVGEGVGDRVIATEFNSRKSSERECRLCGCSARPAVMSRQGAADQRDPDDLDE